MEESYLRLLQFAATAGHRDLVALALSHGVPVDADLYDGETALVHAARAGHLAVVRQLLMRDARRGALRAFTLAAEGGHAEVVRALQPLAMRELESQRAAAVSQAPARSPAAGPRTPPAPPRTKVAATASVPAEEDRRNADQRGIDRLAARQLPSSG